MSDRFSEFKQKLEMIKTISPLPEAKTKAKASIAVELSADWKQTGMYSYRRIKKEKHPIVLEHEGSILFESRAIPPEDIVFFDLETTGLSGGAGTIVFLVGTATIDNDSIIVEQFFLADYPGEKEFLDQLTNIFTPEKVYVSYNGKGFDTHILKSRFTMHGMKIVLENQIDLLYFSRRFWKRVIGSCTLACIEREILYRERSNDIPGYLIPNVYFDFLRTGDAKELPAVFTHNEIDIVSLVYLFGLIKELTTCGMASIHRFTNRDFPIDRTALGEYLLYRNNEEGLQLLDDAFKMGDVRAGKCLGSYYKKYHLWSSAVILWKKMWDMQRDSAAALELSKYYEHTSRDFPAALAWAENISTTGLLADAEERKEFIKRIERIKRKIEQEKKRV